MHHGTTIPIRPAPGAAAAEPNSACGPCPHDGSWDACTRGDPELSAAPPTLSGPASELRRLLEALAQRMDFPADAPERGGVRALHLKPGEVELQLALPSRCSGAALGQAAFETLRGLLPDTDIYVTHSR